MLYKYCAYHHDSPGCRFPLHCQRIHTKIIKHCKIIFYDANTHNVLETYDFVTFSYNLKRMCFNDNAFYTLPTMVQSSFLTARHTYLLHTLYCLWTFKQIMIQDVCSVMINLLHAIKTMTHSNPYWMSIPIALK